MTNAIRGLTFKFAFTKLYAAKGFKLNGIEFDKHFEKEDLIIHLKRRCKKGKCPKCHKKAKIIESNNRMIRVLD